MLRSGSELENQVGRGRRVPPTFPPNGGADETGRRCKRGVPGNSMKSAPILLVIRGLTLGGVTVVWSRSAPLAIQHSYLFLPILSHAHVEELPQHREQTTEAFDLRRRFSAGRIDAGNRNLPDAVAAFHSLDCNVVVKLVTVETGTEDIDLRVEEEFPAIGAEAVGGVGALVVSV